VIFNSLSPAQERLIAALYRGIADKQLPQLLNDLGVEADEGRHLVDSLQPLLLKDTKPTKDALSEEFVAGAFAEIIRASLLNSADGATVLMERKFRTVHIDDLSAAGLALTLGLASAGVGRVVTHDQSLVEAKDLGPSGEGLACQLAQSNGDCPRSQVDSQKPGGHRLRRDNRS
jgi:hypothetical protein